MKTGMRWACFCGTVLVAGLLQEADPREVRVWLLGPDEKPVDLEGFSATLTVTDLKGWKKAYVMPVARPREDGTVPELPRGEVRKVPGTPYRAELLFLNPFPKAADEPSGAAPQIFDLPHRPKPAVAGENRQALEAPSPSFRAPISKQDLPKEGELGVHFSLPDGRKVSVRWSLPLWAQETPHGEGWTRPWEDLAETDRHLRSEKIDRAREAADRLVRSLQNALKDAELDAKKSEDCLRAALEIRRRLDQGDPESVQEAVGECRARFRELAPFADRLEREK